MPKVLESGEKKEKKVPCQVYLPKALRARVIKHAEVNRRAVTNELVVLVEEAMRARDEKAAASQSSCAPSQSV